MTERSSDKLTEKVKASIRHNLNTIRQALDGTSVTLMAATKTVPSEWINYATQECGLTDIGENRVQELLAKYDELELSGVTVHFIGTLQPNKVKYLIGRVSLIHSLDSLKLAEEISRRSAAKGLVTDTLCEVNIGEEEAKGGIPEGEVRDFLTAVSSLPGIRVRGLMVIGPHCPDVNDYRPFFARTKALFDALSAEGRFGNDPILSMGMSDNYALAAAYGSTLVRPGTAVFGARQYPKAAVASASAELHKKI